jgi:hypothetical protein
VTSALEALQRILSRVIRDVDHHLLRKIAQLVVTYSTLEYRTRAYDWEDDSYSVTHTLNCSKVRDLARQELTRRGLEV